MDRYDVRTDALTARPRLLRPGEREPSWNVTRFDLEVPRSVILETANEVRDALGWRGDELVFFLVDVPGALQLCVRGRAARLEVAASIRAELVAAWPEVFR